jgi:hypothetical protein
MVRPPKLAQPVISPPNRCQPKPWPSGSPQRSKASDTIRPAGSRRSSSATGVSPTEKAAVTWFPASPAGADQRTPNRGSSAVGSHTPSAPARPAALREMSAPSPEATVTRPASFHCRAPAPSR